MLLKFVLAFAALVGSASAATYKCIQGGKSFYSDTPCAHDAKKADAATDSVTAAQYRQAHSINALNRDQLQAIEQEEARARNLRQMQQRLKEPSVIPEGSEPTPRSRRGRRAPASDD